MIQQPEIQSIRKGCIRWGGNLTEDHAMQQQLAGEFGLELNKFRIYTTSNLRMSIMQKKNIFSFI